MSDSTRPVPSKQEKPKKLRAVAEGFISMGPIEIECVILEDGKQVLGTGSIMKLMGISKKGGSKKKLLGEAATPQKHVLPGVISAANLIPFAPNELAVRRGPIIFSRKSGGSYKGYDASILPDICETYLAARQAGILTQNQLPIAATLEIVTRALSRVGLSALINEACGVVSPQSNYLQIILSQFISKELLKWTLRFPRSFFDNYNALYGIEKGSNSPSHIGKFIKHQIYGKLAPGVIEELESKNPITENGRRKHAHHQLLSHDIGCPALEKQIAKVNVLMSVSESMEDLKKKINILESKE